MANETATRETTETYTLVPLSDRVAQKTRTNRDKVYDLLREAGKDGVSLREFGEADIRLPGVHVESLQFEGHGIESSYRPPAFGRPFERRWFLVKDAWA